MRDVLRARAIMRRLDDPQLEIVGAVTALHELADVAAALRPDVVLVDAELVARDEDAILDLRDVLPEAALVVFVEAGAVRSQPMPPGATGYVAVRALDDLVADLPAISSLAAGLTRRARPESEAY